MATVLAGSGGVGCRPAAPTRLCFLIGAVAAFVGVAITALVPRPTRGATAGASAPATEGAVV